METAGGCSHGVVLVDSTGASLGRLGVTLGMYAGKPVLHIHQTTGKMDCRSGWKLVGKIYGPYLLHIIVRRLRSRMGLCYCPRTRITTMTAPLISCSFAHWRRPFLSLYLSVCLNLAKLQPHSHHLRYYHLFWGVPDPIFFPMNHLGNVKLGYTPKFNFLSDRIKNVHWPIGINQKLYWRKFDRVFGLINHLVNENSIF